MGSSSKTQKNSTSSNTINPQQMAMYQGNYNTAQQNAAQIGQPYTGQLTAGFTPAQVQAQGILSGVATNPQYQAQIGNAVSSLQGVLGNLPNGDLANADLAAYENPYTKNVIDATMTQLAQQQGQQQVADNQAATAAHAFGGSRQGVADALTNQFYDQDRASTLANLNSANFTQAQAAKNQSFQNAINSGVLGNQTAGNIANLTNQNFAMAANQGALLANIGQQQQAQQQAELSNAYNNWLQGKQLTLDQQQLLNQALGMIPIEQTQNSKSTSETQQNPGAAGILGGLGSIALAAALPGSGAILGGLGGGSSLLGGLFGGGGGGADPSATMPFTNQLSLPAFTGGVQGYGGIFGPAPNLSNLSV